MTALRTTDLVIIERLADLNDVPITAYLPVFTESDFAHDH